jgi:hypothetical protein
MTHKPTASKQYQAHITSCNGAKIQYKTINGQIIVVLDSQYLVFSNQCIVLALQYNENVLYWRSNPSNTNPIHHISGWYWRANTNVFISMYCITNIRQYQYMLFVGSNQYNTHPIPIRSLDQLHRCLLLGFDKDLGATFCNPNNAGVQPSRQYAPCCLNLIRMKAPLLALLPFPESSQPA